MAFNAKNLHYEKQEPAFLRKLRSEHGSDRHNVQFARPKKDRLRTGDDEEDGPTIVDEAGDVVGRDEYAAMVDGRQLGKDGDGNEETDAAGVVRGVGKEESGVSAEGAEQQPEKQRVAEIGGPKKRKAVKVVREDVEDADVVKGGGEDAGKVDGKTDKSKAGKLKPSKKAKKVKLSFDEAEE